MSIGKGAGKKARRQIYFPYKKIRAEQDRLLNDALLAIEQKRHLLAHAPTGLGKTAAVLCPAISYALAEQKTVFFLTPKVSQHEIAVQLINDLNKKFKLDILGVDLVGRRYMCSNPFLSDAENSAFYELCKRLRKKEACEFFANAYGFNAKQRAKARLYFNQLKKLYKGVWHHIKLKDYCESFKSSEGSGLCSYEIALKLAKKADIIIADYFHILNPQIQHIVLQRTHKELSESILIVDEAHNLPERLRKLLSATLSTNMLDRAKEELKKMNAELEELNTLKASLRALAKRRLAPEQKEREALVKQEEFEKHMKGCDIEELSFRLRDLALDYLEAFPIGRSALLRIANFLDKWQEQDESFIRIVRRTDNRIALQLKALDASIVSKPIFDEAHASVLMSGTLLPTRMYADLLGLEEERTLHREYKSPFPQENKLTLVVPNVTTKYSERSFEEYRRIAKLLVKTIKAIPGNVAVFFPSFELAHAVGSFLEGALDRKILVQKENMSAKERFALLSEFRKSAGKGAVLLAVAAGSFAEGIDYIGEQLLGAIIVGIPLREMDLEQKCLIEYYQHKFGAGWHYAYIYPAITRAIQAAGRVIRDRNDRGVVVFLDKRYLWQNYAKCFPGDMKKIVTTEPEKYIAEFWKRYQSKLPVADVN
ncbi:MAG: ATP-dependent DNA helicase [Candidatus Diapherotrites archaeon]|nr:ATP-dependent DNA helicase [Candidatus Diapherotrites archaeon]